MIYYPDELPADRAIGRLEGKLDQYIDSNNRIFEVMQKRLDKHDREIDGLSHRQHWYAGASAAFGAIIGYFGKHFTTT